MIRIIDNVISKTYQDNIEETFLGPNIPWTFNSRLASETDGEVGFGHNLILPHFKSEYYNFVLPLLYEISEKSEINVFEILAARSFLQVPSTSKYDNDVFHVNTEIHHKVFLYYVNDSDGNTIISNSKYELDQNKCKHRDYNPEILEMISPKKGRAVVFDGSLFHSAGIPKFKTRCVINFDVVDYILDNLD